MEQNVEIKKIPLLSKFGQKKIYDFIVQGVLKGEGFQQLFEDYLSVVASRYGYDCYYGTQEMPERKIAFMQFERGLIMFNKLWLENMQDQGSFFELVKTIEHEFAHFADYKENETYQIGKNNFGRIREGGLGDMLMAISEKDNLNLSEPEIIALKYFGNAMYILGAEEVIARESALHYTNQFLLDLKEKQMQTGQPDPVWDLIIDNNKIAEKNKNLKCIQIINENKSYVQGVYNKLVAQALKNNDQKMLQELSILQDSQYFYSKANFSAMLDYAEKYDLKDVALNLLNSKYSNMDTTTRKEKVDNILTGEGSENLYVNYHLHNYSQEDRKSFASKQDFNKE